MELSLPLPASELPEAIRRFGDPAAPGPARTMAARGLVPVKGELLVALLVQLEADSDETIATSARKTLEGVPDGVLLAACSSDLHPLMLDRLCDVFRNRDDALEKLVANHATADSSVLRVSGWCSESIGELIAVNQQRILGQPAIIEALYKNKHVRMSTADRLIELAARNGLELAGIPHFNEIVESLRGEVIPEPSDEPLPEDLSFAQMLAEDADDPDAIEPADGSDAEDVVKARFIPLQQQLRNMKLSKKIRAATLGDAASRAFLVRDPNRLVSSAAISSPRTTDAEVMKFAKSKDVAVDVLRYIGARKEWARSYEVKKSLIYNPKTPTDVALRFLPFLRDNDLKALTKSRNVPGPLRKVATRRWKEKERGKRK